MLKAIKVVALAAGLSMASSVSARTEVLVFFDTEDFTSDRANDAVRDLANLCHEEGVRAHFAIVGYLAREIMRHGRKDVISALKPHIIGSHTLE